MPVFHIKIFIESNTITNFDLKINVLLFWAYYYTSILQPSKVLVSTTLSMEIEKDALKITEAVRVR
jgi:hypothetical protein